MFENFISYENLGYISIILGSATGLVGAFTKTKNENGRPNIWGMVVIFIICSSIGLGIYSKKVENEKKVEAARVQKREDSLKTAQLEILIMGATKTAGDLKTTLDTLSDINRKTKEIDFNLNTTNKEQKVLQNEQARNFSASFDNFREIESNLNESYSLQNNLFVQQENSFSNSFKKFDTLIDQSKNLLYPIFPMVIRFTLEIPFEDTLLTEYKKRVIDNKTSIIKNKKNGVYYPGDGEMYVIPNSDADLSINDKNSQLILEGIYYMYILTDIKRNQGL